MEALTLTITCHEGRPPADAICRRPGGSRTRPDGAACWWPARYLCLYYIGSGVADSAGGVAWADGGWAAVALLAITLLVIALAGVTMPR